MKPRQSSCVAIVLAAMLCALGAVASYLAAGKSLGLFIGGIAFATLITPQFVLIQSRRSAAASVIFASSISVAIVWMIVLHQVSAIIVLATYLSAICGIGSALLRFRLPHSLAAAIVIILALLWLSWPMWWTNPSERAVAVLVPLNPIFNLNALDPTLGIWTQQPIMYRLTTLGQDVPFRLPQSIWPCAIFHAIIALLLLLPANRPMSQLADGEPSDR